MALLQKLHQQEFVQPHSTFYRKQELSSFHSWKRWGSESQNSASLVSQQANGKERRRSKQQLPDTAQVSSVSSGWQLAVTAERLRDSVLTGNQSLLLCLWTILASILFWSQHLSFLEGQSFGLSSSSAVGLTRNLRSAEPLNVRNARAIERHLWDKEMLTNTLSSKLQAFGRAFDHISGSLLLKEPTGSLFPFNLCPFVYCVKGSGWGTQTFWFAQLKAQPHLHQGSCTRVRWLLSLSLRLQWLLPPVLLWECHFPLIWKENFASFWTGQTR